MKRRSFLRASLAGAALLGVGGALVWRQSQKGYAPVEGLRALSAKEHAIVAAVARRIVRGDGGPTADETHVADFVDGYVAGLDEAMRDDVRALLHIVEHGTMKTSRFTRLDGEAQDAVLAGWESSALTVRRRGFQALRSLVFMGYYRDERTWPLLGYSGPIRK